MSVVPLLVSDGQGGLSLCAETAEWIAKHDRPFAVVCVAGRFRTGKSFLLNRLAELSPASKFGVGDTVQSCTKGVWICKHFYRAGDGHDLLYMDTEGLDSLDGTGASDFKIFTSALLLSSLFVFNSVGTIDESAMQTLSVMTRVADSIRASLAEGEQVAASMPAFLWVLRDFSLRLEDRDGRPIENGAYLEQALQDGPSKDKESLRRALRETFPVRQLETLPRPSKDEYQSSNLDDKPWLISARFHAAVDELRSVVTASAPPMAVHGCTLTGAMYARLCEHVCATSAPLPATSDAWSLIVSHQNRELQAAVAAAFDATLEGWSPDEAEVLASLAEEEAGRALADFGRRALAPLDPRLPEELAATLRRSAEARVAKVGRRMRDVVDDDLAALDAPIDAEPTRCLAVVNDAEERFAARYGAAHAKEWRAAAATRLWQRWFPRAVHRLTHEIRRGEEEAARREEEARKERARSDEAAERRAADSARRADELDAEAAVLRQGLDMERAALDAARAALTAEREGRAEAERETTALRSRIELLAEEGVAAARSVPPDERTAPEEADVARREELALLETRYIEQSNQLEDARVRLADAEAGIASLRERERALTDSWTAGLARVRREAEESKRAKEAKLEAAHEALERLATEKEALILREKESAAALDRAGADAQRDLAAATEATAVQRAAAEAAQARMVEMHRTTLEDIRLRDERIRALQAQHMQEQGEYHAGRAEAVRRADAAAVRAESMKRRIEDLETIEFEVKKVRSDLKDEHARRARAEAEAAAARERVTSLLGERDGFQRRVVQLEGELSVLRAEKQLRETSDVL